MGEEGEKHFSNSRNLIRPRREKSGRARLNGSMRKRGVFEVGWRRRWCKAATRHPRSPSAFWWTSWRFIITDQRRGVAWRHAYEIFAASSFQFFFLFRIYWTISKSRREKILEKGEHSTNSVIWRNHLDWLVCCNMSNNITPWWFRVKITLNWKKFGKRWFYMKNVLWYNSHINS